MGTSQPVEVKFGGKYIVREFDFANHPLLDRQNSDSNILAVKYPRKIPIILQRAETEKYLKELDRKKYLVPEDLTLIAFQSLIRRRLKLVPEKALFFLVNGCAVVALSKQIDEIYREYKAPDGFLYINYASEDCFGCIYK